MRKRALYFLLSIIGYISYGQTCPSLTYPPNGSTDIPVDATLSWPAVNGISGLVISLGTTPDGIDILNRRTSGPINSYKPEVGLPENTLIYVSIILFVPNEPPIICDSQSFYTGDVTTPPPCTQLNEPVDNQTTVDVGTKIEWDYASTATGYRLSIGTTPSGTEILNNQDVGNVLSYGPPSNLPLDTTIYVQIVPYNENGDTGPCIEESFTTGVVAASCFQPPINIPDYVSICEDSLPTTLFGNRLADGHRWYKLNDDGTEILLSEENAVPISQIGQYKYEVYNSYQIDCINSKTFNVRLSEKPIIREVQVSQESGEMRIAVQVDGNGDYEYALNINGPYQNSSIFNNLPLNEHTIHVRDKNGCGMHEKKVERDLTTEDFPKFFTPNGDGINDFWQFIHPKEIGEVSVNIIRIFDRYGNFLAQIDPNSQGWDGNLNGSPLPPSSYWFNAISLKKQEIQGYFVLKR
ncbi:gliding motility-associated-like protein [Saonia flava]|uniref:Gliding motility-associated-like protein n=1 Tax=Saonia flava TaxID=523696 RepID=A0A846QVW4_9FLAO|nr:T9SS type B sorting domain-containing protein [Saonia flava]NJB72451.1 gliding motility-associated-like protein [Saonia flava]